MLKRDFMLLRQCWRSKVKHIIQTQLMSMRRVAELAGCALFYNFLLILAMNIFAEYLS